MDKSGKNKHYTFMVIPHDSHGKPISFHVPLVAIRFVILLLVVSVALFSFSLLYSAFLSGKLIHYGFIFDKEAQDSKQVDSILNDKDQLQRELQSLLDQNNELRKTLGLKINKTKVEIDNKSDKKVLPYGLNNKLSNANSVLKLSFHEANETKVSFIQLKAKVKEIQKNLASTPSGWPLKGPINSGFGYRISPWRGMHTGIDIKAPYGSAVHVTAPGVVCFAGWMQGYGKAIEVDHLNGFKTLYGHNSVLAVTVGEKVKKGEIVSYVGMTGFTTGPHLHYEVRKYDSPINPVAFLNLSVMSAGKYF